MRVLIPNACRFVRFVISLTAGLLAPAMEGLLRCLHLPDRIGARFPVAAWHLNLP